MIRVLFFGPVADQAGMREWSVPYLAGMRLQDVIERLKENHRSAFELVSMMAVNGNHTRDLQIVLREQDEIALMAKFSGG